MKKERENQSIYYFRKPTEEEILYKEYQSICKKIKELQIHIKELSSLFTDRKTENLYDEEFRSINIDYLLTKYYADLSKEKMEEEKRKIDAITKKMEKDGKDENEKILQSLEASYNGTKEEYDKVHKKEIEQKKGLDEFAIYGHSIINNSLEKVKKEIDSTNEEIQSLENKKVEIIRKIDYIVYGEQKVKRR